MSRFQIVLTCAVLAGCSSTPSGIADPEIEQQFRDRQQAAVGEDDTPVAFKEMMLKLELLLDKYAGFEYNAGLQRAETNRDKLDKVLRETVAEHYDELVRAADNPKVPRYRANAVAALGFSDRRNALGPILNGAEDPNPEISNNAIFGLGILADPRTPPEIIARVINDPERTEADRTGAAWSLYQIQQNTTEATAILSIWLQILDGDLIEDPEMVSVSALRGIGLARDPVYLLAVERYCGHPVPRVRMAAAIALGRLGDPAAAPSLMGLIGSTESNDNVRLAARKALMELAGGVDREYDVVAWQKVFERQG